MATTAADTPSNPWAEDAQEREHSAEEDTITSPAPSEAPLSPPPQDLPPTYTSSASTPLPVRPRTNRAAGLVPLLPNIIPAAYNVPLSTLSSDRTTQVIKDPALTSSPAALLAFLSAQAALPPKPLIRVLGYHQAYNDGKVIDFDLSINMMPYFIRPANDRWDYVKLNRPSHMGSAPTPLIPGDHKSQGTATGLDEYVRAFCADPTAKKTFTLERVVLNLDAEYIEGQIRGLLAHLKYKGVVAVSHSTQHSKVVVHAESQTQTQSTPNKKKGLFSSLFEGVARVIPPKDYPVVQAIWPYASCPMEMALKYDDDEEAPERRKCAVMSEMAWWNTWKGALQNCILTQRKGWVSAEDQLEFQMGYIAPLPKTSMGKAWGQSDY